MILAKQIGSVICAIRTYNPPFFKNEVFVLNAIYSVTNGNLLYPPISALLPNQADPLRKFYILKRDANYAKN
jgi:hypothetical protein